MTQALSAARSTPTPTPYPYPYPNPYPYPKMLIVSGLNDPRVAYWEPTKWAQVLRAKVPNGEQVLLKMDLAAGHFSAADRYRYLRELAFDYAWLLDTLGKADCAESK